MQLFGSTKVSRYVRHIVSMLLDLSMAAGAFAGAYLTIFGYPGVLNMLAMDEKLLGFLASAALAFLIFAPYRGSWRYVSIPDLLTIVKSAAFATAIYTVGVFLLTRGDNVPRSVLVLTPTYMIMALGSTRMCYRVLIEYIVRMPDSADVPCRTVLLCGFSDKAESFIRASRRAGGTTVSIAGMIDDARVNLGRTIQGVTVIGNLQDLENVLTKLRRDGKKVDELVVTEASVSRQRLAHVLDRANTNSLRVSRIPNLTEMAAVTSGQLMELRPIELSDLLERPEMITDIDGLSRLIADKVVLVTGAGGSIGSELCRQIVGLKPSRLIITDNCEFLLYTLDSELRQTSPELDMLTRLVDVREPRRVIEIMEDNAPEVVFHAAALKHVPLMEDNSLEAIKTNVLGTRNVADAALKVGASIFVMISTDKTVNPTSIMGATKRAAEAYCQTLDLGSSHTQFKTVRFGNVLGSNGSVVPRFREQIAAGGPVTVTHPDIVRYFMTIPEAVRLVLNACAHGLVRRTERGKIMVLDMGKPVRIVDLAERMIQLAGLKPRVDIDIVFTGLRPGEKLYEELFDPLEIPDARTAEGYVVASPRILDRGVLEATMTEIAVCVENEDDERATELLTQIVPEYMNNRGQISMSPHNEHIINLQ